jgi:glycosyltransferase involved in cell wall biosynthesis
MSTGVIAQAYSPTPALAARIKVLQVLEATGAGTACYVSDLLSNIDTAVFDVALVYSPIRADQRFLADLRHIAARGVHIHEIRMQRNIRPFDDAKALWALYRLIKKHKFDIVHGHSSKAGFLVRLAARLANSKIITVYSPHAIAISVNPKYWYLERFAGFLTNVVLGVSRSEHQELETYQFVPSSKLRHVTAGINFDAYIGSFGGSDFRQRLGIQDDTILIGSAGRLTAQKDPVTLLKAAAELLSKGVKAHVAWAGDGDLKAPAQKLARELGIDQHVTFLGYFPDLRPFLDALDIFALVSRYESFGYVTCEAMAMHKPVVATKVSGSSELVVHGETGYLVDIADSHAIAAAFEELAADWNLRRRMGDAGCARARKHYGLARMSQGIEQVYRDLLSAPREVRGDDRRAADIAALEVNRP